LLEQQSLITIYRLLTKENKLPFSLLFAENKLKFAISIFSKLMEVAVFR
jgi:hypothetical protein